MASRLKFISDTYLFELMISKNEPRDLSALQDIVFPVVNITRDYFRRQYDLDLKVEVESLKGLRVFGDQTMVTLVLNALIDNAGKYTIGERRPVIISGNSNVEKGELHIVVANYGLPIDEDEVNHIFEKRKRGRRPIELKISGTGVGLHLGRAIMERQGGNLRLIERCEPVKFAMVFKKSS